MAQKRRSKQQPRRVVDPSGEEPFDMAFELRKANAQMKRNAAQINAGESYASQRRRGREQSSGRSDGQRRDF